uniref:Peptidase C14 caspase domain-containing protein n=1 Tax=Hemiselmis tepida TaxID=464990 RepID=A0A7S0YNU0_9CRYP|mmetsp:Transcript_16519/g.41769  ORF Transcript_16519/g.41769 Transcript_16519/m.41769 type:complete len:392 (+) Transcript_16519:67-1242(+)
MEDKDGDGVPDGVAMAQGAMGGLTGGGDGAKGPGGMAGLMALAGGAGGLAALAGSGGKPSMPKPDLNNPQEFASRAAQAVAADVRMFSGCKDEQTSADVYDVSSFGLPANTGPGGAGGACTNSIVLSLHKQPECTWTQLLQNMRQVLREKNFTQIPQLSSSRSLSLNSQFTVKNPAGNGRTKALYIGINYVGQQGELRGCHNDVEMMKTYIEGKQGFDPSNAKVLMDDGRHESPSHLNILQGFQWLVNGAQSGDSLFMHYSGHGGSMPDDNGDESDGRDETMCPVDYASAGQIRDDVIYEQLVAMLPDGCQLTVVMDCCHSGSILDLPYNFEASDNNLQAASSGAMPQSMPNPGFDFSKALKVAVKLFKMYQGGAGVQTILAAAAPMIREV